MTNIDYCGIVNLLRQLVEKNLLTRTEAKKIAARIAAEEQVDIVLFLRSYADFSFDLVIALPLLLWYCWLERRNQNGRKNTGKRHIGTAGHHH